MQLHVTFLRLAPNLLKQKQSALFFSRGAWDGGVTSSLSAGLSPGPWPCTHTFPQCHCRGRFRRCTPSRCLCHLYSSCTKARAFIVGSWCLLFFFNSFPLHKKMLKSPNQKLFPCDPSTFSLGWNTGCGFGSVVFDIFFIIIIHRFFGLHFHHCERHRATRQTGCES